MQENQSKLVELLTQKEAIVKQLKELEEVIDPLLKEVGEDSVFQADNGQVYKIRKATGRFIPYKDLEVVRTRGLEGDPTKGGTFLSKKEAKEAGFIL